MKSIPRQADCIVSDNRIINNDIIGFTETQIKPLYSTCKIIGKLNLFNINFNNIKNKFWSLTYGCRNGVADLNILDANRVSILSFKKHAFANSIFTLMFIENNLCICKNFFRCCNSY